MKRTVRIPDDMGERAGEFARRTNSSFSQLLGDALREYLARHEEAEVTAAMDRVCAEFSEAKDGFVSSSALQTLKRVEW